MFYQDKDKRKLMFALSFAFASISLAEKIIPSTGIPFIQDLYDSGGFPIIFAVLITGFSGLGNYKSFDKFFQAFLGVSIITVFVSIFLLFDYPSIRLGAMIGLTFLTLGILIFVLLRKRKTGDLLFLFSIASFAAAGFGPRLGFGTEFFLLCQGLAYVFIILVFMLPNRNNQWSNSSFFKVQQQLAKTKEQLENLELKYKIIFDAVGDAIFVADAQTGLIVDCNLEATKLVHRDRADIIGKHQSILHPKQESDGDFFAFQEHAHGDSELIETQVITSNEELRDVAIKAGVFELNGKKMLVGIFRNVTELKKAEEEKSRLLHDMGERVKELNCFYGISKIFEKSDVVLKNALIETVKLLPLAMRYSDIACAKIVVENQTFTTKNFNDTQWILQSDINVNGKRTGFIEISYLEERSTDGEGQFIIEERNLIDAVAERLGKIIERKQAEVDLKQAEEKHRTLLTAANVLVQSVDAEGKFVFVNEEWKKTLGYTDMDLAGITIMNTIQKDHLQYCLSVFKQVMNGTCIRDVETVFVTKDGKEIVVRGNACPISKDGEFVSTVAFFVDITERKKNEKKLKESNQRIELMNEKLRVVGSLTRHDVRNKLSAVTGYAYLLKKKHSDQADIVEGLDRMEQAVKESVKIFDFAKLYEQLGAEELTNIDVEAKISEAKTLFSSSLPKIINDCHGLTVLADSFLRQMFYNFIDNTRKYGQKTSTIKIHYQKTDQGNLVLIYEDDGVGISAENKERLFHEGFSTGGSTGFGLFLTKKMIDVYGWKIEEDGIPNEGVKFIITIPKLNKSGKENYQIV